MLACGPSDYRAAPTALSRPITYTTDSAHGAPLFDATGIFDYVPEIAEVVATIHNRDNERRGLIIALQAHDAGACGDLKTPSMQFVIPDWKSGLQSRPRSPQAQ